MTDAESVTEIVDRAEQALARSDESAAEAALATIEWPDPAVDPVLAGRIAAARGRLHRATAEADFRMAAELFAGAGDEDRRQDVLGRLGALLAQRGRAREGMALLRAAVEHFRRRGDADAEVWTSLRLVGSLVATGDRDEATRVLDHVAELAAGRSDEMMPGAVAWARADVAGPDIEANLAATTEALREFTSTEVARMVAAARLRLTGLWRAKGEPDRALGEVEQALASLPESAPAALRATLLTAHGDVLMQLDRPPEAVPHLVLAADLADQAGEPLLAEAARRSLAAAYQGSGQLPEAVATAEEAVRGFQLAGDLSAANGVRYLLAEMRLAQGDKAAALVQYDKIVSVSRSNGLRDGVAQILTESADLLDQLDRDEEAANRYRLGGEAALGEGDLYRWAYCRYQEALSLVWCGRIDDARQALVEAERAVSSLPDDDPIAKKRHTAQLAENAVRVCRAGGHMAEAIKNADRAITLLFESEQYNRVPGAQMLLGQLLIEVNQLDEAEKFLRAALENVTNQGGTSPRIAAVLATALELQGKTEEAEQVRAAASIGATTPS